MNALCDCFWWSANNSDEVIGQLLLFSGEWSSVRVRLLQMVSDTKGKRFSGWFISFVDLGF
jgi:hypothetical protein